MKVKDQPVLLVFGFIILILLIAYLVPSITAVQSPTEELNNFQNENETIVLQPGLSVSLVTVSDNSTNISLEVYDEEGGSVETITNMSESTSENITVDGDNLQITYDQKIDNTTASLSYQYPRFYGWPSGAVTIISNIVIILLVFIVLLLLFIFYDRGEQNGD